MGTDDEHAEGEQVAGRDDRWRPTRRTALEAAALGLAAPLLAACDDGGRTPTSRADDAARSGPAPTAAPPGTLTRIAATGDTGTGPGTPVERTVAAMVRQGRERAYDGLLLLGDLVYPDGRADQVQARVLDVFEPVTRTGARLLPMLGNHDYLRGEQEQILEQLDLDAPWYVTEVGVVRVVVLDTEQVEDPDQTAWLERTLAAPTDARWTVVTMHKSAYSAGVHGENGFVKKLWVPLVEAYGVKLVVSAHDHDYQRSKPLNGVTYVVTGGGASPRQTGRRDFTAVSASELHFVDLAFGRDAVTVRAVGADGTLVDEFQVA